MSSSPRIRQGNRLAGETSPYLLQHAGNPVDWYPWGDEAFARARGEGKPVFVSIGYAACHWCHVMEREVFEDEKIAALMNEHFVNIKVDREERPDLDDLYMLATQLMTGSGGWPMSVWLTPELEPFYAGTYFPPEDRGGRPGFPRVELAIVDGWQKRRGDLVGQAKKVVEAIRMHADETSGGEAGATIDLKAWFATAIEQQAERFDEVNGGLGTSPKFPPHQALHLWLSMLRNPSAAQLSSQEAAALEGMTVKTLDAMMRGGIYDHVGGGFARYSTDERWQVPHFEKMLYDNAQLAAAYGCAAVHFRRADYARVARQTLDFWLREMTSEKGAFYSTLDADSEGAEGKFYVWTPEQIAAALPGDGDAKLIMEHFGVTAAGNWAESPVAHGSVLAIAEPVEALAARHGETVERMQERIDALLGQLREVRGRRVPPLLDDKVLTSWNGLMISALAVCGRLLREPRYLEAAHRGMGFLLTEHMAGGQRLLRVSREKGGRRDAECGMVAAKEAGGSAGSAHTDGFLEDHAYLLNGLMDLVDATSPTSLPGTMSRKRALELADVMVKAFEDKAHGGFFFTSERHEAMFARMKNAADNATPSANGVAVRALLRLAAESGQERYRDSGMRAVRGFAGAIAKHPEYFATVLQAVLEDAALRTRGGGIGGRGHEEELAGAAAERLPIALTHPHGVGDAAGTSKILSLAVEKTVSPRAGGRFEVVLELTIAKGYHIQPHKPENREAFSTVARLRGDAALGSQAWDYPEAEALEGGAGRGYSGKVRIVGRCALAEGAAAGMHRLRAIVLAQPCTATSCLPPERVSVEFGLSV